METRTTQIMRLTGVGMETAGYEEKEKTHTPDRGDTFERNLSKIPANTKS